MAFDIAAFDENDRKVFDWIYKEIGGDIISFVKHPRWRLGWDVVVEREGARLPLYVRGPRGEGYLSPVDMFQEVEIHRAFLANGIPAPYVYGMIDDPLSIVMERLPGRINTEVIADAALRDRIRDEFIGIVARLHQIPLDQFKAVGLKIPQTADEIALCLYTPAEAIFRRNIGTTFPIMSFITQWLRRNVPQDRTRACFVNPDAGQFVFDDDKVTGLIDFEVSCFGDPAAELAGLRLRDTTEPLGDLSKMIDRYEELTGDRISKKLIEYHSAGFCGVNGYLLWPLAFNCSVEQDYIAYMNYSVATTRWSIKAIADFMGLPLAEPRDPLRRPLGFPEASRHLERRLASFPDGTAAQNYLRDAAGATAHYLGKWNDYGPDVVTESLADASRLVGKPLSDWEAAQEAVEAFVLQAGPEEDARLVQHFHNWLRRQDFLLKDCGQASYLVGSNMQEIPRRLADMESAS